MQTWKSIVIKGATTGFSLLPRQDQGVNNQPNTGSVMIVDSVFQDTDTAILTFPPSAKTGSNTTGITLDNVKFSNVHTAVKDNTGTVQLSGVDSVDTWVLGRIYVDQKQYTALSNQFHTPRAKGLLGDNPLGLPKAPYFERAKPQYADQQASSFVQMKDHCTGKFP